MPIVNLSDIVDAMEMTSDMMPHYLNKKTGEISSISQEEMNAAENEEEPEDFPDWQQDSIKTAQNLLSTDDYISLPSQFDIHEYQIMEKFCLSMKEPKISDDLNGSIKGRGAFRRFKDKILEYGIEEDWYQYKDNAYREIAKEWCEENGVEFTEDLEGN